MDRGSGLCIACNSQMLLRVASPFKFREFYRLFMHTFINIKKRIGVGSPERQPGGFLISSAL
jgi:hypothetical protein